MPDCEHVTFRYWTEHEKLDTRQKNLESILHEQFPHGLRPVAPKQTPRPHTPQILTVHPSSVRSYREEQVPPKADQIHNPTPSLSALRDFNHTAIKSQQTSKLGLPSRIIERNSDLAIKCERVSETRGSQRPGSACPVKDHSKFELDSADSDRMAIGDQNPVQSNKIILEHPRLSRQPRASDCDDTGPGLECIYRNTSNAAAIDDYNHCMSQETDFGQTSRIEDRGTSPLASSLESENQFVKMEDVSGCEVSASETDNGGQPHNMEPEQRNCVPEDDVTLRNNETSASPESGSSNVADTVEQNGPRLHESTNTDQEGLLSQKSIQPGTLHATTTIDPENAKNLADETQKEDAAALITEKFQESLQSMICAQRRVNPRWNSSPRSKINSLRQRPKSSSRFQNSEIISSQTRPATAVVQSSLSKATTMEQMRPQTAMTLSMEKATAKLSASGIHFSSVEHAAANVLRHSCLREAGMESSGSLIKH